MPLLLLRSAMVRRLWLAPRLLLASFFRRSRNVSSVCPWPLGRPTTLAPRSGRKLEEGKGQLVHTWLHLHKYLTNARKHPTAPES